MTLAACCWMASTTRGWQWPRLVTPIPVVKSRNWEGWASTAASRQRPEVPRGERSGRCQGLAPSPSCQCLPRRSRSPSHGRERCPIRGRAQTAGAWRQWRAPPPAPTRSAAPRPPTAAVNRSWKLRRMHVRDRSITRWQSAQQLNKRPRTRHGPSLSTAAERPSVRARQAHDISVNIA